MTIYELILTLDYELPVNTRPNIMDYIIKPTNNLLGICNAFGIKLTVMAEIGELWAFEKFENINFTEYLGYDAAAAIRKQLIEAVKLGHDVQLHLHPQWLSAKWGQDEWQLDYSKYRLADLDYHEMLDVFRSAKKYLEDLLCPYCDDYSCIGFRAGNWNTQPSGNYLKALYKAGLKSDTSVFKWGWANKSSAYMDYRDAYSNVLPWVASWDDINSRSEDKGLLEFPIYAEPASIFGMLTLKRLRMARNYLAEDRAIAQEVRNHRREHVSTNGKLLNQISKLFRTYPKKFDFCKLTSSEMLRMMANIKKRFNTSGPKHTVPVVMIGHSKEMSSFYELNTFLEEVKKEFGDSVHFSTYRDLVKRYIENPNLLPD